MDALLAKAGRAVFARFSDDLSDPLWTVYTICINSSREGLVKTSPNLQCSFEYFLQSHLFLFLLICLFRVFRMASPNQNEPVSRHPPPDGSHSAVTADSGPVIDELQRELNRLQRSIRVAIQTHLQQLAGQSFGSLEQNQSVAETVHDLLDGHGLRVQCSECGHPAILRVSPRNGIGDGAFVFDHTIEGRRTFHGGRAVMPEIRLIAKPPRKKAKQTGKSKKRDLAKQTDSAKSVSPTRKSAG